MLNPFYKYIGNQLILFFEKEASRNKTDRYFLYLPTEEIISSLYNALSEHENSESFVYRHEEGSKSYETGNNLFRR
ncbi:hypothetical protein ACT4UT_16395 [Bacillus sp. B-TM1]